MKTLPKASKPFHTANRSVAEQFHTKWLWNLSRLNLRGFAHFTLGYSQRNWQQVLELLRLAQVTMLVDARYNVVSQHKPEFSKRNLDAATQVAGLSYRHLPALGIAPEARADLSETHDYTGLFAAYAQRLDEALLSSLLGDALHKQRLAFLCVEIDPYTCHRSQIALLLERLGFATLDL